MTRHVTRMTIDDAGHFSEARKAEVIASYPEHERAARLRGAPSLGSGRVFPVAEETLTVAEPFAIPSHFAQINGLDFGWDHPFAAINLAHDRDSDCVYVTKAYRERRATPAIHVAAVRPWGDWVPCAWPHDGLQHDKGSGKQLSQMYREHGLAMLDHHATHDEGGTGLEAGLLAMLERMQSGRFRVFPTLDEWLEEFRLYHRRNGIVVKERDDLMSATRIAIMMLREARTRPRAHKLAYDSRGIV